MTSKQWDRADATRDVPVVDGNFWRGVRNALLIEAAIIVPLLWWLL